MPAITFGITDNVDLIKLNNFNILPDLEAQTTVKQISIVESLLSPAVQVMATIQANIYKPAGKNYDSHKNQQMTFSVSVENENSSIPTYNINQKTYRLENRFKVQNNVSDVEEMTFHAVDETVLTDAACLVSKSWKCTKPSEVVSHVLDHCLKAQKTVVDSADPARDYIAENIHPFQVIAQQANVALDGDDPSFLHFMTIDENTGMGVHHFQSLKKLTKESSVETYNFGVPTLSDYSVTGKTALSYSFPCDFDYLSDLLNGLDENGENQNSLSTIDQVWKLMSKLGGNGTEKCDCGLGQFNYKMAQSNKSTSEQRNSCNMDVENHLLKRQARMGLLERDKIALRIVVPWNPKLHAGKVITFNWDNKEDKGTPVYGTGTYLISSMMHTLRMGGFAITTLDCVSTTAGQGIV